MADSISTLRGPNQQLQKQDHHPLQYPKYPGAISLGLGLNPKLKKENKQKKKLFVSVSKSNDTAKTKMTDQDLSVYYHRRWYLGPTRFKPPSSRLEASNIPLS